MCLLQAMLVGLQQLNGDVESLNPWFQIETVFGVQSDNFLKQHILKIMFGDWRI